MTIASALTALNTDIENARTAITNKGGTVTVDGGSSQLATDIATIPSGITPTGTISITQNGTYDVTNYASASVNVSGGSSIGIPREVSQSGVYQMPASSFTFELPSNATDVGDSALYFAFYNCTGLTSADLSSLTSASGSSSMSYIFSGCTNLTSVDLSNLTSASGNNALYYAFRYCTGLTSIDLSSLITVSGGNALAAAFQGRTNLTSINFNSLQQIGINNSNPNNGQFSRCFNGCTNLTSLTFPNLEKIYSTGTNTVNNGTFYQNDNIQKMYFPKLDTITYGAGASSSNQAVCKLVFSNCSSLTELHFAAANQSAIEASPGYSTAWGRGAGNVTIYFDL